jgi:putative ATPase
MVEYKYAHDYNNNFADQEFLPEALKETPIYIPNNSRENSIREFFKEQMEDKYGY